MIVYIIFLFVEIGFYLTAPKSMEKSFMFYCLLSVVVQLVYFFCFDKKDKRGKLKGIYFRHTSFFLASFFVVFFQCDIDYVIGLIDESEKMLWIDNTIVCKSLALATMAMTSVLIGYKLMQMRDSHSHIIKASSCDYICNNKHLLCVIGYAMLALYILFVPRDYLYGGYNEGADKGWANVLLILIQAVFVAMFALYGYDFRNSKSKKIFIRELRYPFLLVLLYIFIVLVTGRRTEAIRAAFLLVIVYSYCMGKKASNKLIISYFIVAAILFSIIGVLRMGEVKSFEKGFSTVSEKPSLSPFTRELAGSVNTLHVAVSYFPNQLDYNYGMTFFPPFCVLIPGLDRFFVAFVADNNVPLRSGEVITTLGIGANAGYGMGSSIVADVYISFGPIGVFIVFLLFGIFLRYLEMGSFAVKKSPYFLVLSMGCFSMFMYACRGTVANIFLSWSYATILVFIFSKKKVQNVKSLKNI